LKKLKDLIGVRNLRILKGIPVNSIKQVIGRITTGEVKNREAKDSILVTSSIGKRIKGFRAVLTSNKIEEVDARRLKVPIIHSIREIEILNEGDIVLLDMNSGRIIVEFEKRSIHNSIIPTAKCNCRCIMCPQPPIEDAPDHTNLNIKIIKLMDKSTQALGITGGEPTLLGNGLIKILRKCKKYLRKTQIQILTNGILLRNNDYVKRINQIGQRNIVFCIPLYADTDAEHDYIMQRKDAFEDTIQGLYNLAANKQLIEIRIVVMSLNYKRLPQIAEFIYHNLAFAINVAFMGMEVEGIAKKNVKKLWVSPKEYSPYLRNAVFYLSQRNMNVSIYNEQLCLLPKELWNFTCKSISEWKNRYLEKCIECNEKNRCGGFFAYPTNEHMMLIQPL
jgi:His-Xaa-Ser system radical SAM maturase HxsC